MEEKTKGKDVECYAEIRAHLSAQEGGEKFANAFEDFVNNYSREPQKAAIARMLRSHRTLQQSMTRFMLMWFEALAEDKYGHDLRNEASVQLAKDIVTAKFNKGLPLI